MPLRTSWSRKLLAGLAFALMGAQAAAEPPPTNSGQGARLHGTGSFEHVNLSLRAARVPPACQTSQLFFDQGKLKATVGAPPCSGEQLRGTAFQVTVEGQPVQFEIKEVRPHRSLLESSNPNESQLAIPGEAPWEYKVVWKRGTQSGALCSTGEGFALAVPYGWSPEGELLEGTQKELFTFACRPDKTKGGFLVGGGVIAKCVDWGYPPWRRNRDTVVNGQRAKYTEEVALKYHQACVRMAAADYCNEGKAHTLDGTPIAFYDATGFRRTSDGTVFPGPLELANSYYTGNYYLEAIWGRGRDGKIGVLCLGKTRWETLSKDATCDLQRRLGVEPGKPVEICEDLPVADLAKRGLLLISYSTFLDRALVRFRRGDEGRTAAFLTTGAVEWRSNSQDGGYIWPDLYRPALSAPGYSSQVMIEGAIFAPHIPREFIDRLKLKALYRCSEGGLFLTTDTADCGKPVPNGPSGATLEGYIASEKTGIRVNPLYLWTRKGGGAYATSTVQPAYYGSPRLLGYLPSVSQLAEQ